MEQNDNKSIEQNLTEAKYRLDLVNHFISMADTKNSIGIGFTTLTTTFLTGVGFSSLVDRLKENNVNCLWILSCCLFVISVVFLVVSMTYYINSLIPQNDSTDNSKVKYSDVIIKLNSYYYRHISMINKEAFLNQSSNMTADDCMREILEEVYYNSGICNKKMLCFRKGLIFSIVSVSLAIAFLFVTMGL